MKGVRGHDIAPDLTLINPQSNVLIGAGGIPYICDFGRSRVIEHRGYTTGLIGSAAYMAPELLAASNDEEQAASHLNLTKASDVYGFAMVGLEASIFVVWWDIAKC